MSDQDTERKQFNLRLNEVAERQLQQLADKLNISKSAVILQAIALFYSQHFAEKPA